VAELGQEWAADDESFVGALARVVRVSDGTDVVYAQFPNGNLMRLVAEGPTLIEPGDVVLVGDSRWKLVERELWEEPRGIGVVRKVLDDRLIVESAVGLVLTDQLGDASAEAGNTVAFSTRGGVHEVLSDLPMRVRDREDEVEDLAAFEFSAQAGTLKYSDFGGYSHVVARARHIIETQFKFKSALDDIKARPVRGVLLSGAPGTGKTYLAQVIAAEAGAAFFVVSGPSIVSKYVGDTEQLLRRIFQEAQSRERAIIFFDEIDSIAGERGEASNEASNRLVAQLLTEMDGFSQARGNVVVLAATNRPESIDPALRRPGRFDWEISFDLPTLEDRLAILEVDARRLTTSGVLPLEELAALSQGWSAAELASVWTEAALLAVSGGRNAIDSEDLLGAFEVVRSTLERKRNGMEA
jgi:transitional endoplasmic reticulum ATPase